MTQRDIATALGISLGLANQLASLPGAPPRAKYRTDRSYLRCLAKLALRHGHTADGIVAAAGDSRAVTSAPAPADAPARAPEASQPPATMPADADSYQRTLESLRHVTTTLGDHLRRADVKSPTILPLMDRYGKLHQELRQSEKHWLELQRERGELYSRDEVHAAAAVLWQTFRAALDGLITRLASPSGIASWIEEQGGAVPPAAQAVLHDRIYALISSQVNAMADALATGAIPATDQTPDSRRVLAAELQRQLERLAP